MADTAILSYIFIAVKKTKTGSKMRLKEKLVSRTQRKMAGLTACPVATTIWSIIIGAQVTVLVTITIDILAANLYIFSCLVFDADFTRFV